MGPKGKPKKQRRTATRYSEVTRPTVPMLRFLGATRTVTGSRFLLDTPTARVLVDCGLFQGLKDLRLRNWQEFPVDPSSIDAVLLTHAHLDHSGYIPALVRNGFRGHVYATERTNTLCGILLPDSGHIQEEDAAYANRRGFSKHQPALPLYTENDARRSLSALRSVPLGTPVDIAKGVRATFRPNGHILGSTSITVELDGERPRTLVFSGDLGRSQHPILRAPMAIPPADFLIVESTYGDRTHEDSESKTRFEDAVKRTTERGGVCVIPSFAVDRTEVILVELRRLMQSGKVPRVPVYLDSPMAVETLAVYRRALGEEGIDLNPQVEFDGDPFDPGTLIQTRRVEESIAINNQQGPAIIISASGMATGGRVLHHLVQRLPNPNNMVILVGFQAEGTRGRLLLEGARNLKMLGRYVPVRAEVVNVPAFSVHADQHEILTWLKTAPRAPEMLFIVHGEISASMALHDTIERTLGWNAVVPHHLEQVRLD